MRSTHMWKMTSIQYGKMGQVKTAAFNLSVLFITQRNASAQIMGYKNGENKRQEPLLCLVFWLMNCIERSIEEETLLQH